ncbi:hypothetical protein RRG08_054143 [Elysia crispata]|uniref:Uncharacterized protein n=1 Tax=Elysia crispata TaxID=231223 RepID=A0AAE1CU06_9GAST|nr:hypothetical protein RRG08_054143 [Elysia crispata]
MIVTCRMCGALEYTAVSLKLRSCYKTNLTSSQCLVIESPGVGCDYDLEQLFFWQIGSIGGEDREGWRGGCLSRVPDRVLQRRRVYEAISIPCDSPRFLEITPMTTALVHTPSSTTSISGINGKYGRRESGKLAIVVPQGLGK